MCAVALLAAMLAHVGRADDDVVRDDEEPVPPVQPHGGPLQIQGFHGGRVVIMGPGGVPLVMPPVTAPTPVRTGPSLGVTAGPMLPQVRAQLDLPEGVGLSIDEVAADGPAAKAGVKQFDVLHKFNDQLVCSPEQLATLVKVVGVGTKVPLTLVRGGRETVVAVVLEERPLTTDGQAGPFVVGMPGGPPAWPALPPAMPPQMQAGIPRQLAEALARAGAANAMPGVPNLGLGVQTVTVGPNAQSATTMQDARGTVEIRSANGKKTVTVKDPGGMEVYSGPLDTDDDLAKVPEGFRDWVREADGGVLAMPVPAVEAEAPAADPDATDASAGPTT
jgi:hypothetical protein